MSSHSEERALPEVLYHYTSQAGLVGMLTEKKIRASKIHYLNDSREFALALHLARRELTGRMEAAALEADRRRLGLLRDSIHSIEQVNTCVCCFSEEGDSLSQWRGYGGGKAGFSVGFAREWFARATQAPRLSLVPCLYDPCEQRRLIREAVDEFLEANADAEPDYGERDRGYEDPDRPRTFVVLGHASNDFATRLAEIAPRIKDESFADEKEWRLVAQQVPVYDLEYRPGESMLIPYHSIPIGDESSFDSIRETIVGPTPHPDLSFDSVQSLAISAGLVNSGNAVVTTKQTSIPFRNW